MSIALSLAVFFVIWWTTLFAILPFGLRTQAEAGEIVPGTPESAPAKPRMGRLFLINTVVASVIFAGLWLVVRAQTMPLEVLTRSPV